MLCYNFQLFSHGIYMCLVSVLVPVYNEEEFIKAAIESVLQVRDVSVELILVDDGSTDSTREVISSIPDARVRCFQNPGKGKVKALNHAYSQSRGDFFVLFAGDDLLVAGQLKARIEPLREAPSLAISLCKVKMFSDDKRFDGVVVPKNPHKGAATGGGMAFNKGFAKLVFPIPDVLPNEDTWIKNFIDFYSLKVFHVPVIGLLYRIHSGNSLNRDSDHSVFSENLYKRERASQLFLADFGASLDLHKRNRLAARCRAQKYRFENRPLRVLACFGLGFRERISLAVYASPTLYFIRNYFYSFFSGR